MDTGQHDKVADFDLEIQAVAEKSLGVHLADAEIVAVVLVATVLIAIVLVATVLGRRLFRELDILGPHRHQNRIVRAQILSASHI